VLNLQKDIQKTVRRNYPSRLFDEIYEYNDGGWDLIGDAELAEKILDAIHKWGVRE